MTTLINDDFVALTAWTNGGGVSISPTSWAYHPGNAFSTGYIYRTMGAGVYCETKTYLDGTSTDWMMLKIDSGNLYNNAAGDGVGIAMQGNGGGFSYVGGTLTYTGWAVNGSFTVAAPNSAATACTLGVFKRSSTNYDFYCNGAYLGNIVTTQASSGSNFALGAHNSIGGHFDYFASADHLLTRFEPRNTPAPIIGSG